MVLKLYVDRISQPSRAVLIFCEVNSIDYEEVKVVLSRGEHLSAEFEEVNPMRKVPALVDGNFRLFESHAILIYLAVLYGVADHWYPSDLYARAKIHSILDWHHSNLRSGAALYVLHSTLGPFLGRPLNPQAAAEAEETLSSSLSMIETFWLKGDGGFLLGASEPSIADLSLVCEMTQLDLVREEDRMRILSPYKKVGRWLSATRDAMDPHFNRVHETLEKLRQRLKDNPPSKI